MPQRPRRLPARALRKQRLSTAKTEAQVRLSNLDAAISKYAEALKNTLESTDRRRYVPVLSKIYKRLWAWKTEEIFDHRAADIAALQGETLRKNSTTVSILIKAVCARAEFNLKTANRWAGQLRDALNEKIRPDDIEAYLRG